MTDARLPGWTRDGNEYTPPWARNPRPAASIVSAEQLAYFKEHPMPSNFETGMIEHIETGERTAPLKLSGNMMTLDIDRETGDVVVPEDTASLEREFLRTSKGDDVPVILTDEQARLVLSRMTWSSFAIDLSMKSRWSVNQRPWAHKLANEQGARDAERIVEDSVEPGLYQQPGGNVYRVQFNKERTARYVKMLGENGWEYLGRGSAFKHCTPANRMSVEAVGEWGRQTGVCMVCSRTLTDPKSIAAGIGPVCAGRV